MKSTLIFGIIAAGMLLLGVVWLKAAPQAGPVTIDPTMGTPSAMPTAVSLGTTTLVTFTIPIVDPSLIESSVNAIVSSSGSSSSVYQMYDDGTHGDMIAGDNIYTGQIPVNKTIPATFQLQASAAFRGLLKRSLSATIRITVTSDGTVPLPPDPGSAGKVTVAGIDADDDGVRDDVQRYIALTYPTSPSIRSALTQLAEAQLSMITDAPNPALAKADTTRFGYAIECVLASVPDSSTSLSKDLESVVENTQDRMNIFAEAQTEASPLTYRLANDGRTRCIIPPSTPLR